MSQSINTQIQSILGEMDADSLVKMVEVIALLHKTNKLNKQTIDELLAVARKAQSAEKATLTVVAPEGAQGVTTVSVPELSNVELQQQTTTDTKLEVKGAGYFYQRSLDNDLKKLLK